MDYQPLTGPVPLQPQTDEELEEELEHLRTVALLDYGQELARAKMRYTLEKHHADWVYDVGLRNIDVEYEQALRDADQQCHDKLLRERDMIRSDAKEFGIGFDTKSLNIPSNNRRGEPAPRTINAYPTKDFGACKDTLEYFYVNKNDELLDSYISKVLAYKLQLK